MAQVNAAHLAKRAHQLVPLTVLAGEAHRENRSHAKRRQIIQNGSATTGLRTNVGHVQNLQPGLDGSFSQRGVDLEIPIQTKIADQRHAKTGKPVGDFTKTLLFHDGFASSSARDKCWTKARLSHCK